MARRSRDSSAAPEWWLAGIGISIAGALVAAATSLIKAVRMPVLATAQPHAWQQRQRRWLILQSGAACAVFAVALLLLQYGQSLIAGFGVLAALMFGAALILPAFLEIILLARPALRAGGRWRCGSGRTAGSSSPDCRWR